jgi:hypothetical protein
MERRSKQTTIPQEYLPESKYSMTHLNINKYRINHKQCGKLNDKYYLIEINPYTNELLKSSLPIYSEIKELIDGIYIYVVLGFDDEAPQIYLLKTLNLYELGTKHQQLIYRISCDNNSCKKFKLYYAGELQKIDNNIFFNFYSGTFKMETKIKKKLIQLDIDYMVELLNKDNDNLPIYKEEPFITSDAFILTEEDLDLYKSMGANVYEFENEESCKNYSQYFYTNPTQNIKVGLKKRLASESKLYGGLIKKTKRKKNKKKYSHKINKKL